MKPEYNFINGKTFRFSMYFLTAIVWLCLLGGQTECLAYDVSLAWVADSDPNVVGYKVYYQQDSSALPFSGTGALEGSSPIDSKASTTAKITGLDPDKAYYFAVTAYDAAGVESSYSNIVPVLEGYPPTVSITSPANSTTASGIVSIAAGASDNVGVTSVEFYVNGKLLATETSAPYVVSWDTTSLPVGTYTISAKALDAAGNVGQSSNISVSVVNDAIPPVVFITAPFNNATVSGVVPISVSASDNFGLSKVEIYGNGSLLFVTNVPPYNYAWNTTAVANGSYALSAVAYDTSGNISQSANVTATVFNDVTAPTVTISAPANNATVSGTVSVTASAFDNVGVSKVEFYLNGILKSTATTAPYSFSWDTTTVANGAYTLSAKAYDAAGNIGPSGGVTVLVSSDATSPTVTVTSPANYAIISGLVTVTASATDNVGVTKTELYLNNTLVASSTTAPYSFILNSNNYLNSPYTMKVNAYDAAGNVRSASVVVIIFNDKTAPTASISSPAANSVLRGIVSVTAAALDNVKVTKVEFYVNGSLTATVGTSPYSFSWNTLNYVDGSYILAAKAYDAAGNIGQSANVIVTVTNDTTAPTVSAFTVPTSSTSLTVPISVFSATDNVGVTGYLITESSIAPTAGSVGWFASAPSGYTFTTTGTKTLYAWAKDAAGNVSVAKTATIVISIPKTVSQDVMVLDSSTTYPTIQDAYNTVPESGTIAAKDVTLSEKLNFNRAVNVNLAGGMDASFQSTTGTTAVSGVIKISKGKVVVSKITVR